MRGLWSETNWRLDDDALVLPSGRRIKLATIRQWQENLYLGAFDLTRQWNGWRVRGHHLIAPGGTMRRGYLAEHYLRHLIQSAGWQRQEASRRQLTLW